MTDVLRAALVVVVALPAIACGSDEGPLPQPSPTASNLSGNYTVTLTADSACADLPTEARSRTYAASMTLRSVVPTRYSVTLRGSSLIGLDESEATITGDVFRLDLVYRTLFPPDLPRITEEIGPMSYYLAAGTASATVVSGASSISATFDGWIAYCALKPAAFGDVHAECGPDSDRLAEPTPSQPVPFAFCDSPNHQMVFTRH